MPFEGSGPDPKDWWGTSEDYVDRHERPDFEHLDGQVKYTNPGSPVRRPQTRSAAYTDSGITERARAFVKAAGRRYVPAR